MIMEVNPMKEKWSFIVFLILGFLWVGHDTPVYAQNPPKPLTLLYSNNINGEIEPCPT
jgi:hypothetical protein